MRADQIIKRIIPREIRNYIKKIINEDTMKSPVEYIVRSSEVARLHNKAIVVTGGTGAIGSAVTHRLYAEGATVGICGRSRDKVDNVIERFEQEKIHNAGRLIPLYVDVTDDIAIDNEIDRFVKQAGRLDALINNAGGGARSESKFFWEQDVKVIDRVLNTNLRGSMICARKAAQIMIQQNAGVIVNMSSVVGMNGKKKMTDYSAAKAGIIGFTKSLALELGMYNIRVNCVSPGMVNQISFDIGRPIQETDRNCLKRFGYTDEVANLMAFIVSDDAAFITGHNFVIDGGRSLGLYGD